MAEIKENNLTKINASQIKEIRVISTSGESTSITPEVLADLVLAKLNTDANKAVLGELVPFEYPIKKFRKISLNMSPGESKSIEDVSGLKLISIISNNQDFEYQSVFLCSGTGPYWNGLTTLHNNIYQTAGPATINVIIKNGFIVLDTPILPYSNQTFYIEFIDLAQF